MPAVPAPYPPETLAPDPLALYGREDVPGNGEVQIVQTSPAAGDTIVRRQDGQWANTPGEPADPGYLTGNLVQEGNTARPARSNLTGNPLLGTLKDEAAALITKAALLVPIPVVVGDVISKIAILTGATAANGPEHQWGALYEGKLTSSEAVLLQQSADGLTAAIAAKSVITYTLAKPVTVTAANAPFGYLYGSVSVTASTAVPSVIGYTAVAVVQEALAKLTNSPAFTGAKFSVSGTEGVAKSPSGALASVAAIPLIIAF